MRNATLALRVSPAIAAAAALLPQRGLAQAVSREQRFPVLQAQLWQTDTRDTTRERAVVAEIWKQLDEYCIKVLTTTASADAAKDALGSFHVYRNRRSLIQGLPMGRSGWIVAYNLSRAGESFYTVVQLLQRAEGKPTTIARTRLDGSGIDESAYWYRLLGFLGSADANSPLVVLAGENRISSQSLVLELRFDKKTFVTKHTRKYPKWGGGLNSISLTGERLAETYPKKTGIVAEGIGDCMLLMGANWVLKRGELVREKEEILNPWYARVLEAVSARRSGDKAAFKVGIAPTKAWDVIPVSLTLWCMEQRRTSVDAALVRLGIADRSVLAFRLRREKREWVITNVLKSRGRLPMAEK